MSKNRGEEMKTKAVRTDKNKTFCEFCGTWTVSKKICMNINHSRNNKGSKFEK
jgi:ribosomal protein L32